MCTQKVYSVTSVWITNQETAVRLVKGTFRYNVNNSRESCGQKSIFFMELGIRCGLNLKMPNLFKPYCLLYALYITHENFLIPLPHRYCWRYRSSSTVRRVANDHLVLYSATHTFCISLSSCDLVLLWHICHRCNLWSTLQSNFLLVLYVHTL